MRAEIHFNVDEILTLVSDAVHAQLKPLLAKNGEEPETLFTVKTLANYLHVSQQWVYERVHLHEIPFIKMGKFPRFKKSDIDRWLDSLKTPALQPLSSTDKVRMLKVAGQTNLTR